ncbi:hypothetical protein [Spirosoma fluminis]
MVDNGQLTEAVRSIYPEGVDKVVELVGSSTLQASLRCLKLGSTGSMSGMLAESWSSPQSVPMDFIPAMGRLTTYNSGQVTNPAMAFQHYIRQVEAGQI